MTCLIYTDATKKHLAVVKEISRFYDKAIIVLEEGDFPMTELIEWFSDIFFAPKGVGTMKIKVNTIFSLTKTSTLVDDFIENKYLREKQPECYVVAGVTPGKQGFGKEPNANADLNSYVLAFSLINNLNQITISNDRENGLDKLVKLWKENHNKT